MLRAVPLLIYPYEANMHGNTEMGTGVARAFFTIYLELKQFYKFSCFIL